MLGMNSTLFRAAVAAAAIGGVFAARGELLPGLEEYGDVTLVDEILCATDTEHLFHDFPVGRAYVTNILGADCVAMRHVTYKETETRNESCALMGWRVGRGKGIVPSRPHLLLVEYPDDAPRSVTLMNFGNGVRHGYHTGFSVGDYITPRYVEQSLQSWDVPLSGEYKQLVEVMLPVPFAHTYDDNDSRDNDDEVYTRMAVAEEGFDLCFGLASAEDATDSLGAAVRAIRLYRIEDYEGARPDVHYPAGDAPRRLITSREEMGDGDLMNSYSDGADYYKDRAKLLRLLGMNGCSRDLLEFGYLQYWDSSPYGGRWGTATDRWPATLDAMTAEGIAMLPFYEYAGSRGRDGWGLAYAEQPQTLNQGTHIFSNQQYVYQCLADVTRPETLADIRQLLDLTVLRYLERADFRGVWFRSRGQLPIGFHPSAIAAYCASRGLSTNEVTREKIYNGGSYYGTALYEDYRAWWYGRRRALFEAAREHLATNGLPGAKFFYTSTIEEPGECWQGSHPVFVRSGSAASLYEGKTWSQMSGVSGVLSDMDAATRRFQIDALDADKGNYSYQEFNHSAPAHDYRNYVDAENVALAYPFNTVYTAVCTNAAPLFRNASGDLFFVRHYSLNENMLMDEYGNEIAGYFTSDFDQAGRAAMLSELWAMAVSDPTILGYLFGSNVDRLDAPAAREFNLNFLALPAQPGRAVVGGHYGDRFTLRRWDTPQGSYFAAINPESEPYEADVAFTSDPNEFSALYRAVDSRAVAIDRGVVHVSLEPYQMVSFTTVKPTALDVEAGIDALADTTATVRAEATAFGGASATVATTVTDADEAPFATILSRTETLSAPRACTYALSGLEPGRRYRVRAVFTDATGAAKTRVFHFTCPAAAGAPTATLRADPAVRGARVRATVSSLGGAAAPIALSVRFVPEGAALEAGCAARTLSLGSLAAPAALENAAADLSSVADYRAELWFEDAAGSRGRLATARLHTPAPTLPTQTGVWMPGLFQAQYATEKTYPTAAHESDDLAFPDFSVDFVDTNCIVQAGPVMADTNFAWTNDLGQVSFWGWTNRVFGYDGQMWFEGGRTYVFHEVASSGAAIDVDGAHTLLRGTNLRAWNAATASISFPESGWHDFRAYAFGWAIANSYGAFNKSPMRGFRTDGHAITGMGMGWNTNGVTSVDPSKPGQWSHFRDPGDGSFFRHRSFHPNEISLRGAPYRDGSEIVVPVSLLSTAESPDPDRAADWTAASAAVRAGSVGPVALDLRVPASPLAAGATVRLAARYANARTGRSGWSEIASYTAPADATLPEAALVFRSATCRSATFDVRLLSPGSGASSATLELTLTLADGAVRRHAPDPAAETFTTDYDLPYGASGTATLAVRNNLGRTLSIGPVAFALPAPEPPAAPAVTVSPSHSSAAATALVPRGGTDTERVGVVAEVAAAGTGFALVVSSAAADLAVAETGALSLAGLDPDTDYELRVRATGASGAETVGAPVAFRTLPYPVALGRASAIIGPDGAATLTVPVVRTVPGATLSLVVDGAVVRTWSDLEEGALLSATIAVDAGVAHAATFELSGESDGPVRAVSAVGFSGLAAAEWFKVRLDRDGYAEGADWWSGIDAATAGSWSFGANSIGTSALVSGDDAAGRRVAHSLLAGSLDYAPSAPSPAGTDVSVRGSLRVSPANETGDAALPDASPFCLLFVWTDDSSEVVPVVRAGGAFRASDTHLPAACASEWLPYQVDFDFTSAAAPAVRVSLRGQHLLFDGASWLPCPGLDRVTRVRHIGAGSFDDFEGFTTAAGAARSVRLLFK